VIRALQSSSLSRRYWYKRRRQISRSGSFILRQSPSKQLVSFRFKQVNIVDSFVREEIATREAMLRALNAAKPQNQQRLQILDRKSRSSQRIGTVIRMQ